MRALPALLIRISTRPKRSTQRATTRLIAAASVRSAAIASIRSRICTPAAATVSSRASCPRAQTSTAAPSASIASAVARPIPLLPPVMIATLPSSWSSMLTPLPRIGADPAAAAVHMPYRGRTERDILRRYCA